MLCNRHYIQTDAENNITGGWSDGPMRDRPADGAILLAETGGYQFRLWPDGEENPALCDEYGIPLYRWDGERVVPRPEEELDGLRAARERIEAVSEELSMLENRLSATDFWTLKYTEGEYDGRPDDWEEKKRQRKSWREEVRRLGAERDGLNAQKEAGQ